MRAAITRSATITATLFLATAAHAQDEATAVAKQLQNPVADMTSFPLQFNFRSGGDLGGATQMVLNIQPVFPLQVNDDWNVIVRPIMPYVSTPVGGGERVSGLGDLLTEVFFTPAKAGRVIWGVGPALSAPTATNDAVASGEWAAGPTAVVVYNTGPFVLGGLAANIFHFAGEDADPKVNQLILQPFINYNLGRGWALSTAPLLTANWNLPSDDVWTVPLGLGISKVDRIGQQPINLAFQYYHNVVRPTGSGSGEFRVIFGLVFPKARHTAPARSTNVSK